MRAASSMMIMLFCQIVRRYKNNTFMFCQNKTLFLKVKNRYIFRLANVTHAEHEENKKEDLQLQFMMCDLKLAQAMLCNMCRNM
jgi:hypothetical protein